MTRHPIDLTPLSDALDLLEAQGRSSGTDIMAATIWGHGCFGEPILLGRDPVSRFLSRPLPVDCRVWATVADLRVWNGPLHDASLLCTWSLAPYPWVQALLSMIEDLYYPELWEREG